MDKEKINILLFEDNPGDALLVKEVLSETTLASFKIECFARLTDGLSHLIGGKTDVILLDLTLLDSWGLDTFKKVKSESADIPLIVLTSNDDGSLALKTIQEGGQDYIVKGQIDSNSLVRSILYAMERHRIKTRLEDLTFLDELTGLCNRRGFVSIAEQHIKYAQRASKNLLVVYADLDGMKGINDILGHLEGDLALIEMANILKKTFRESDVIARIGGDEFAIIALQDYKTDIDTIRESLQKRIDDWDESTKYSFNLSISIGIAYYDNTTPCSIDQLLNKADKMMYKEKRTKDIS